MHMGSTWITVDEGCPLRCEASGSGGAYILIGEPPQHELTFEVEALRDLVTKGAAALAQMDAMAEREEAEYEAKERSSTQP